jgi:hypothetical protein
MGALTKGTIWDRGVDILNTERDPSTGTILAQLGDSVNSEGVSDNAEWIQHVGLASRPSKPTPGQPSAQAVILRASDQDVCIASTDRRCQAIYGSLDYGETVIYAPGADGTGQARVMLKGDGSVSLYTRAGNSPSGQGMTVSLDAQGDRVTAINSKGFGIIIDDTGVTLTSGASGITLGADGSIRIVGTATTQIDGTSIVLGSLAIPIVNSPLCGPVGIAGVPSLKTLIQ